MHGEGGPAFLPELLIHGERLHPDLRAMPENRRGITGKMMIDAYDLVPDCRKSFEALFRSYDIVLTPAVPGEAPEGLHTTGDWVLNVMWTVLHVPCIAIPCTTGDRGLPVGIQIIGPRFSDPRLLQAAHAVARAIDVETPRSERAARQLA